MLTIGREAFFDTAREAASSGYWNTMRSRWRYHELAALQLKRRPTTPERVLELGTMGVQLVPGSHTMDLADWMHRPKSHTPTYCHDAREIPWPIADGAYDWFVAMRVFHHLIPVQREAFFEALRISRNVLLVVPESSSKTYAAGITRKTFASWRAPDFEKKLAKWGRLYVWHQ